MSNPYTRSMAALHWFDTAAHPLPGPAAGKRWVVRDLVVTNLTASSQQYSIYVVTGTDNYHLFRGPAAAQTSVHLELRQVLDAGEQLGCYQFADGQSTLLVTGYEFDA